MENKKYVRLIQEGGIFSYSLAKGTFILPPNGFILWEQIKKYLDYNFNSLGVKNVSLPTLIPVSLLEKEKEHIDGFSPELFLVERKKMEGEIKNGKETRFDEKLVLRPTSEVLFYQWFSSTLHSYKQLPFLYNQWGQVFRAEKNTKPFLRNTEFLWQEGHTLHIDEQGAKIFSKKIILLYKEYVEKVLCLPAVLGMKTSCEKFSGALESYTIECLLPDYQCLQVATSHYFGKNFSKPFNVKFRDEDNLLKFPFSTSWGTSTRAIGALALAHSDENGLVFPFQIAPIQVGFIRCNDKEDVKRYELEIYSKVFRIFRCKFYNESDQFGVNLANADKEGCSVKIIIGSKELEDGSLTISLRTFSKMRIVIDGSEIIEQINNCQEKISNYLYNKSLSLLNAHTFEINKNQVFLENLKSKKGIFLIPFCNRLDCEINVKSLLPSFSFRCIPSQEQVINKKCIFCSCDNSKMAYFGRSY